MRRPLIVFRVASMSSGGERAVGGLYFDFGPLRAAGRVDGVIVRSRRRDAVDASFPAQGPPLRPRRRLHAPRTEGGAHRAVQRALESLVLLSTLY